MKQFFAAILCATSVALAADKPNIIFILSDDLAQGDLGCYEQKLIQTPREHIGETLGHVLHHRNRSLKICGKLRQQVFHAPGHACRC